MQLLEAIFVAVESKSNDVFSSRELAELFGTTQKKFTDYTYSKGWLEICDNLDTELTALDCTFLIAQIIDSGVRWANKKVVADVFQAEPFTEIAESASVGSNSLRFRIKRKTDKAWQLEETVKTNKTKIADNAKCIFANSQEINSLKIKNAKLEADNAELKAGHAKLEIDNAELKAGHAKLAADNAELETRVANLEVDNAELKTNYAKLETKLDAVLIAIKGSYGEFRENIDKAIDANLNGQVAKFAKVTVNKLAQPLDTIMDALVI